MSGELLWWLTDILIIIGLVVLTIAVYGVFRMPDLYTQLHAASKTIFLGVIPLLVAASLTGDWAIVSRAILIGVFLVLTTPVAAHAIARAAFRSGELMQDVGLVDESRADLGPVGADRHHDETRISGRKESGSAG